MNTQDLFQALEFAHYAERYRDKTFVIALERNIPFEELLPDIKVLGGYHIRAVLVVPDAEGRLADMVAVANKRGARLAWFSAEGPANEPGEGPDKALGLPTPKSLNQALDARQTPLVALPQTAPQKAGGVEPAYALAAQLALALGAQKLALVTPSLTPFVKGLLRSHMTHPELSTTLKTMGPGHERRVLAFIRDHLEHGVPDIILLEGKTTALFQEVFTYDGAGLLFNLVKNSAIRSAQVEDITHIMMLLRPEIEAKRILPVSEATIERDIAYYRVYEVEGDIVGLARLKIYEKWAEMAQFITLHRYRGRGRAKVLAARLEEEARAQGLEGVFALSVEPRMWSFFQSLGFREIDRHLLPESWKKNYDFNRPSHAFLKEL